jgi:hypothetical protein
VMASPWTRGPLENDERMGPQIASDDPSQGEIDRAGIQSSPTVWVSALTADGSGSALK